MSKASEVLPAAFSMLEKIRMPAKPGYLSAFTLFEGKGKKDWLNREFVPTTAAECLPVASVLFAVFNDFYFFLFVKKKTLYEWIGK